MNTQIIINTTVSLFSSLLGISIIINSVDAHAVSAEEACNRPILKVWKEQQSERLWSPNDETLMAEKSGKVFTYNCFTFEDINRFFDSHENRIENAHFYPILKTKAQKKDSVAGNDGDDDC